MNVEDARTLIAGRAGRLGRCRQLGRDAHGKGIAQERAPGGDIGITVHKTHLNFLAAAKLRGVS